MSLKHPEQALAVMTTEGLGPQGNDPAEKSVLTGSISGSLSIPKHTLKMGDVIRIRLGGPTVAFYDNAVNITARFKIGGAIVAVTWMQAGGVVDPDRWWCTVEIVVGPGGAVAAVASDGHLFWPGQPVLFVLPAVTGSIDTTIANSVDFTFEWAVASNFTERYVNADTAVVQYLSPGP